MHSGIHASTLVRSSVKGLENYFSFWLPAHKTDFTFEGNNACRLFYRYIYSRDAIFPLHPFLWVRQDGTVGHLWRIVSDSRTAGQSLRAGGATVRAEQRC